MSDDGMPPVIGDEDDDPAHVPGTGGCNASPLPAARLPKPDLPTRADGTVRDASKSPAEHAASMSGLQNGNATRVQPAAEGIDSPSGQGSSADGGMSPTTPEQQQVVYGCRACSAFNGGCLLSCRAVLVWQAYV